MHENRHRQGVLARHAGKYLALRLAKRRRHVRERGFRLLDETEQLALLGGNFLGIRLNALGACMLPDQGILHQFAERTRTVLEQELPRLRIDCLGFPAL